MKKSLVAVVLSIFAFSVSFAGTARQFKDPNMKHRTSEDCNSLSTTALLDSSSKVKKSEEQTENKNQSETVHVSI